MDNLFLLILFIIAWGVNIVIFTLIDLFIAVNNF